MKECLVTKAREKCQCEDCRQARQISSTIAYWNLQQQIIKIDIEALKDAGVVPK